MVWKVLLVIAVILVIVLVALYYFGRKLEKRQAEGQAQLDAAAQTVSMLIIDKKKLRMKQSGLPQQVIDQTPKRFRGQKVPIVKAKIGNQIMSLMCDEKIFEQIPVKKSVKAKVSGIYILEVHGLRSTLEAPTKKRSFRTKMQDKLSGMQAKAQAEVDKTKKK